MKFIHLSDLHIGKRVNDFSMLDDQKYILDEIKKITEAEKADSVIIAGDIYDKSVPSAESVQLFDEFLGKMMALGVKIFIISGNHDSAERIAFGAKAMAFGGVFVSPVFDGEVKKIEFNDEFGKINVYLLPFVKPVHVRPYFEEEITDTNSAIKAVVGSIELNKNERNVMVCHQFITGAERSESEEIYVGGVDNVDSSVFDDFDYVALGHIHRPQSMGREHIRYCGTPLKYSFSEINHEKSVTVVEMDDKNKVNIKTVPLKPIRDMRHIKGTYEFLTTRENYIGTNTEDYLRVTLLDEEEIFDAIGRLRTIYPNIMRIDYENKRTSADNFIIGADENDNKQPIEFFEELFELQNNRKFSESQRELCRKIMDEVWEVEK